MKNHRKLLTILLSVFVVISILFVAWFNYKPTKISYFKGCIEHSINITDLREVVGVADYVFVGYVEEIYDYNHDRLFHKFPKVIDYYGGPFTECKVTVTECIKGNIPAGETLSYYKVGGVTWLRTNIYLDVEEGYIEQGYDDYYPEMGKYYVFRGFAHPDGTITGGGINSTEPLEENYDLNNYKQSIVYQKWINAYENQIFSKYGNDYKYLCSADADYGDGTYNADLYARYIDEIYDGEEQDEEYYKAVKAGNPKIK
ncbi:MAG: hypothetical protein IKC45_07970 [Clostridia bacterium]|nr:hypothetical protein [Clostridia bacterium]